MGEKKEKKKETFIATTIYLPPDLKTEIDIYKKEKNYGTRSELFRRAFYILKKVYPLDSSTTQSEERSLFDRLESIEQKLQELKTEKDLKEKELETLDRRQKLLERASSSLDDDTLPDSDKIEQELLEILGELGPMKDFVLMNHLGDKYDRGVIWKKLMNLQQEKKIAIKEGKWYKKNGN